MKIYLRNVSLTKKETVFEGRTATIVTLSFPFYTKYKVKFEQTFNSMIFDNKLPFFVIIKKLIRNSWRET